MKKNHSFIITTCFVIFLISAYNISENPKATTEKEIKPPPTETPEYFNLRPEVEKAYGYSHAVKIGNDIKYQVP